ncbi:MAG: hypothetical protein FJ147_25115 [Deltaproteobacteria bacterium]|nr:hypothetical protein [Deltaproteobacteria bacterium]
MELYASSSLLIGNLILAHALGGLPPFKHTAWYFLWAVLGVRASGHRDLTAHEVARRNYEYAHAALNYWSGRQYRQLFAVLPISWSWEEVAYMQVSYKPRILQIARWAERIPFLASLIRTYWTRVLVFRKDISPAVAHSSLTSLEAAAD